MSAIRRCVRLSRTASDPASIWIGGLRLPVGVAAEQILVIDDDLGRSAASALDRPGFQRLVAEVGLAMWDWCSASRSRAWRALAATGISSGNVRLFDTLIGDAAGIYDPSTYNDRLLVGLKGTMSEAEIHILKARMHG